jgi:hypothetical protein
MNEVQLKELYKYLDKHLEIGFIQESTSEVASLVMFIPKKNRTVQLVIDYQQLNTITIKDRIPLLLISELRDRLL